MVFAFLSQRNQIKLGVSILIMLLLVGCTRPRVIHYDPQDFINPNRVIDQKELVALPPTKVHATYSIGNDPAVIKAYEEYTKDGVAKNINSKGFETFAYDAYSHPIVACAPLHLCMIQLERGEHINNIDLGDAAHWLVGTSLIGTPQDGSYQVAVKPKLYDLATDIVITTNKRTYNIGLVSKRGADTHVVNFYYPEETLKNAVQAVQAEQNSPMQHEIITSSNNTTIDLNHINFNYNLSGDYPPWRPIRVFDDGTKTYIQMSPISERIDLPVLYILNNKKMALVNYRYRRPYYIVDGLFQTAYLVSGSGSNQVRVEIDNHSFG